MTGVNTDILIHIKQNKYISYEVSVIMYFIPNNIKEN